MKTKYRNVSFLVELLINVLVFSISCAVLVGLFGRAGEIARQTKEQGHAAGEINAIIQTLKAAGPEALQPSAQEGETLRFYYDSGWNQSENADVYTVDLKLTPEARAAGTLYRIDAVAIDAQGREICRMESACYQPQGEVEA